MTKVTNTNSNRSSIRNNEVTKNDDENRVHWIVPSSREEIQWQRNSKNEDEDVEWSMRIQIDLPCALFDDVSLKNKNSFGSHSVVFVCVEKTNKRRMFKPFSRIRKFLSEQKQELRVLLQKIRMENQRAQKRRDNKKNKKVMDEWEYIMTSSSSTAAEFAYYPSLF